MPAKKPSHKWEFSTRFRSRGFGWNGTRPASQRLKEALSEIKSVARKDPVLAGEGAIRLMEKLWPALEHIDSSSGALGTAVYNTVNQLVDVCVAAPADVKTREAWLERLWSAVEEDGVGYLQSAIDRWGELCASPAIASSWAELFLPTARQVWLDRKRYGYYRGTTVCLSCLLACNRHGELLDLLELAPFVSWHDRQFGVQALAAMGQIDEAIAYAHASRGLNDSQAEIDSVCEEILLAEGRVDEAYEKYALTANWRSTHVATYRAVQKKYPDREPLQILRGLIALHPDEEGKWFATAKGLGFFDLALELVSTSPGDPRTLNRAARDFVQKNPRFALGAAFASLRWISRGYGYEITVDDVNDACRHLGMAAASLNCTEEVRNSVRDLLQKGRLERSVEAAIRRHFRIP